MPRIAGLETIEPPFAAFTINGHSRSQDVLKALQQLVGHGASCVPVPCNEWEEASAYFRTYPLGSVVRMEDAVWDSPFRTNRFFSCEYFVTPSGKPSCPPVLFTVKIYAAVNNQKRIRTVAHQIYADFFDRKRFLAHTSKGFLPWDESYKNWVDRPTLSTSCVAVQLAAMAPRALATAD